MAICIDPKYVDKIKNLDLGNMTSQERMAAFEDALGANGREINLLYEKSLLLKNKKSAFDKFVDNITGIGAEKKAKIKEQIAIRMAEKNHIINDDELLGIVQDTLNRKYDLDIPDEVVQKMFNIKKEIETLKAKAAGTPDGSLEKLEWGMKEGEISDIIADLKNPSDGNIFKIAKQSLIESGQKIKAADGVLGKTGQTLNEIVSTALGVPAKGIKAAWDASYLFRQGLKVLTADPKIWGKEAGGSLKSWTRVYSKEHMKDIFNAFRADIVTRDLYQDAIKSKLAIGVIEDFFPTNIAEKIPALGNLFKASDDSFTMFSQGTRMDLFEKYVKDYVQKNGEKPPKEIMDSLANYVNGLTGRGGLGKLEPASSWLNQLFFSARYQVANLKTFTDPLFSKTPEVRRIAAKNLAVHTATLFSAMTTLAAITDVGFDPRDKHFGKARIPNTDKWVDVTGGLSSYISLLGKMYDKSQTTPKYGEDSALDILVDFGKGKLAPVPGAIRDFLEGRDYSNQKPTPLSTLRSLFVPITVDNAVSIIEKGDSNYVLGLSTLFDILGAGVSTPKSKPEGSYGSPLDLLK